MSVTLTDTEAAQLMAAILTWRRTGDQGQAYPADLTTAMQKLGLPGAPPVPVSGPTPATTQSTISIGGHKNQRG
jgi:hypothetical protein